MTTGQNVTSTSRELDLATEPIQIRHLNGGVQALFRFPNGYGASVVRHGYSYGGTAGLWELAVIKWDGKDFELVYDTAITEDVVGHLTPAEVDELLLRIKNLGEYGREPETVEDVPQAAPSWLQPHSGWHANTATLAAQLREIADAIAALGDRPISEVGLQVSIQALGHRPHRDRAAAVDLLASALGQSPRAAITTAGSVHYGPDYETTTVVNPFACVVSAKEMEEGRQLAAEAGKPSEPCDVCGPEPAQVTA